MLTDTIVWLGDFANKERMGMPILNFKEIPEAHVADGRQDTFELFARDFLEYIGYRILSGPDRGADGGKDLIVMETRVGVGGETTVKWLVSCKHKAFSGKSVTPDDDFNIGDRLAASGCQGFIGFYSTLPSAGLAKILTDSLWQSQVFDREKIESKLLHASRGIEIAERYFPSSIKNWKVENVGPAEVYADRPNLPCNVCGRNLLDQKDKGVVTLWYKMGEVLSIKKDHYERVHWTCRGYCDDALKKEMRVKGMIDGWEDINDVTIPIIYIRWVVTLLNQFRNGTTYSDEAFDSMKGFILGVFPYVARHATKAEKERIKDLVQVPAYLGGLGY